MNTVEENGKESYCCPNPNCGKVFSKPKIIKYYVCPTCQTLIDIPSQMIPDQPSCISEQDEKVKELDPESEHCLNQSASDEKAPCSEKNIENGNNDFQHIHNKEQDLVDIDSLEKKVQLAVEGKIELESEYKCAYYFGYLGIRKEKGIPETCFACPKSVECMLVEINSSEETIQEIKKWYPAKDI